MNREAASRLKAGDPVRHGERRGTVVANQDGVLTIEWNDGERTSGRHGKAWMIERAD